MKEVEGEGVCKERYQVTATNALVTEDESEIKLNFLMRYNDPVLNTEVYSTVHSYFIVSNLLCRI